MNIQCLCRLYLVTKSYLLEIKTTFSRLNRKDKPNTFIRDHWLKNTWMSFFMYFRFSDNRLLSLACVSKSSWNVFENVHNKHIFFDKNFPHTHIFFKRSVRMRRLLDKRTLISHVYLRRSFIIFFPKFGGPFFSFLPIVSWYISFSCSVLCLKDPTEH